MEIIVEEGKQPDAVYIILEGQIMATSESFELPKMAPTDMVTNIIPMLTKKANMINGIAKGNVKALRIKKKAFEKLLELSPELAENCKNLAVDRFKYYEQLLASKSNQVIDWVKKAEMSIQDHAKIPELPTMLEFKKEHHGAPLAVWLGILLDGIPESLVIGAGMLGMLTAQLTVSSTVSFVEVIPFTLIAGLFLSNFPEALSSSANMLAQGWKKKRIFLMWFSLMVITGLGAGIGYLMAGVVEHTWMVHLEGIAAGAMLTMIAAAMIPEAVLMGSGNAVGISTLAGFLSAILFKLFK
ncbi:hypothetical protein [Reichenbachiella sp.]